MPPRARKPTTADPDAEVVVDSPAQTLESAGVPATPGLAEGLTGPDPSPEPARAPRKPRAKTEPPAAPAAPAERWVQVAGTPAHTFCHICLPAGPTPGAGTVGCSHSQWVRVTGEVTL